MSWKIRLLNEWKFVFAQLVLNLHHLSKGPRTILRCKVRHVLHVGNTTLYVQRTYLKVVNGFQTVDTWNVAILEAK